MKTKGPVWCASAGLFSLPSPHSSPSFLLEQRSLTTLLSCFRANQLVLTSEPLLFSLLTNGWSSSFSRASPPQRGPFHAHSLTCFNFSVGIISD